MSKLIVRPAIRQDLFPIVRWIAQETKQGHFSFRLRSPLGYLLLYLNLRRVVRQGVYPRPSEQGDDYCWSRIDVLTEGSQVVGFHQLLAVEAHSASTLIEFYLLAIRPDRRNLGYAKTLLDHAVATIPETAHVIARCFPQSKQARQMLEKYYGFSYRGRQDGSRKAVILHRPPPV